MIRRQITNVDYFGHKGSSVKVTLSCGHEAYYKASALPKRTVVCHDCTHLANGGTITRGDADETVDLRDVDA